MADELPITQRVTRIERKGGGLGAVALACGHSFLIARRSPSELPKVGETIPCVRCRCDPLDPRGDPWAPSRPMFVGPADPRLDPDADYVLLSADHPDAMPGPRTADDRGWAVIFPLPQGVLLKIKFGEHCHENLERLLLAEAFGNVGRADTTEDR